MIVRTRPTSLRRRKACHLADRRFVRPGKHRLIVADARQEKTFDRLMRGEMAEMAFLDSPYNVKIAGHVGGRGRTKHREFLCGSGELSSAQFESFLQQTLGLCARYSIDGSIHYVCMDWRHAKELLSARAMVFAELKNICVWTKTNAGQAASIGTSTNSCSSISMARRRISTLSALVPAVGRDRMCGAMRARTRSAPGA